VSQSEFNNLNLSTKINSLTKQDLITRNSLLESELSTAIKEIYRLKNQILTDAQLNLILSEQLGGFQNTIFGSSSERYKKPENKKVKNESPLPSIKKPSERYPNIPVREEKIVFTTVPDCDSCGKQMTDSGMFEESEQLNMIPKKFEIIKFLRPKFRCSCQACIKTVPLPKRIIDGSSYSDDMIIDVVCSKYCDLIPIERYVQMAGRGGLMGLPPQSLIELTHQFANFIRIVYGLIKKEIQSSRVLHADETPQNMLEGSLTKSWYLWGFSTLKSCYLECHDTRSGDIASEILMNSVCEVIVSDDFGGYGKALKFVNENRQNQNSNSIMNAKCNAHARRYFFKPRINYPECEFYLENYHQIYRLNAESKDKPADEVLKLREKMRIYFEAMKSRAIEEYSSNKYSDKSKFIVALNYFLKNYNDLILFLDQTDVAIDNNAQERLLRSHVVGRKTWYGTHSVRGAETAAILFSIIETCKLNKINPREYLKNLVIDLHNGKKPYTPSEYKDLTKI
jgi:transposase